MKRYGDLFSKIVEEDNLALAHQNARKGKTWYKEVIDVDKDDEALLAELRTTLMSESFRTSAYDVFDRKCGEKIPIDSILNKELTVTGYKIGKTKYSRGGQDQCLTLEIELDGVKHVVFTGSGVLIDQMEKYGCQVPFAAEIVKINKYYRLK